ncbi:hypothetical protein HN446_02215 [bacterium]|jgi:hypothetical protein|nr:hypothetical protein [bacterium]
MKYVLCLSLLLAFTFGVAAGDEGPPETASPDAVIVKVPEGKETAHAEEEPEEAADKDAAEERRNCRQAFALACKKLCAKCRCCGKKQPPKEKEVPLPEVVMVPEDGEDGLPKEAEEKVAVAAKAPEEEEEEEEEEESEEEEEICPEEDAPPEESDSDGERDFSEL